MDEWTYGQMDLWTNEIVDKWTNEPKVKRLELIRNLDDPEAGLFLGVCVKKITDKEMSEQPLLKNSNRHHIAPFVQNLGYERLLPFPGISAAAAARACTHRREHFFPPKMFFTFFRVFSRNARVVGFCCLCSAASLTSRASEEVLQKL